VKIAIAHLKSVSPYSQSRAHEEPKLDKETPDDYERRTWRSKCHADENGEVFIPPMSFKNALDSAAKYLSVKIPGKRNATYTKHFKSGVLCVDVVRLGVMKDDVKGERIYVNADGVRGSGKRVYRTFPVFPSWDAEVTFYVMDDTITPSVFEQHLQEAGKFIGIGRFRPENGGFNGRFEVASVKWADK
jgi:hypothetical protein